MVREGYYQNFGAKVAHDHIVGKAFEK